MSSPQITAKMRLDSRGVKTGAQEATREIASMGQRIRASMMGAMRGALVGGVKIAGAAAVAAIGATVTKGLRDGVSQAFAMENAEVLMKSTLGSVEKMQEAMALINKEAAANPMFSKEAMAEAAGSLSNYARGSVKELQSLLHTAKLLTVLNPEQGLSGAAYALKEALGGDYVSVTDRFNLSKSGIRAAREQGLSGKELVDAMIQAQGVTDATLRDLADTRHSQLQAMLNQITNIGQMFFDAIWPTLGPQLASMQEWMKKNGGEVVAGLKVITDILGIIAAALAGTASVFDKATAWVANLALHDKSPIQAAIRGTSAAAHAVSQFSAGNMTAQAAAQYANNSLVGAQLGSRSVQALASGQVQQASMTINVTGNGVSPQMSNS